VLACEGDVKFQNVTSDHVSFPSLKNVCYASFFLIEHQLVSKDDKVCTDSCKFISLIS
jgi:hypothetical protein